MYVVILQGVTRILLKVLPFKTFKKVYGSRKRKAERSSDVRVRELVYAVSTTARYLKSTCLVQALVLKHLVTDSRLVIGVAGGQAFEAHAWVEREEEVILGEALETRFTPIWVWE
ncbi:Transglutaminase-like superfamily protein [compost metagenome]